MSDALINKLHAEARRAAESMREIADRTDRNDEERAEDAAAFEKASNHYDELRGRLESLLAERKNSAEIDAAVAAMAAKTGTEAKPEARTASWVDELRASLAREGTGARAGAGSEMAVNFRTVQAGAATHGKETVPTTLANQLFQELFMDGNVLSSGVNVIQTASGNDFVLPRLTSRGEPGAGLVTETSAITAKTDPLFDTRTLKAYKYAGFAQISREAVEDSSFDLSGILAQILGQNVTNQLETKLLTGAGTTEPRGIVTAVGTNVKTGATGVTSPASFDDLLEVIYKLDPRYRKNGKWIVNDAITLDLRKLKFNTTDGTNSYAWTPALTAGAPDSLLGYPVVVNRLMADPGLSTVSMVFADLSKYYVRMVSDVRVEWSTEYAFINDVVTVKAVVRADANAIDDAAFAGFEGAAS